jgi:predicted Zn-dependent peptidase
VSAEDLEAARERMAMRFLRMLANPDAFSEELGNNETISTWRDLLAQPERWKKETPGSLQQTAKIFFTRANRTVGLYVNGRKAN